MPNTLHPTQIAYIPTGNGTGRNTSTLILGKNMNVAWEGAGFGYGGRPDYLERLYIYLTDPSTNPPRTIATILFDVSGVNTIITAHPNAATSALSFQIREVDVCDVGVAKKMMILASLPYSAT